MDKREYFLHALRGEAYRYKIWLISVCGVIKTHGRQYRFPYMLDDNPDDPEHFYFRDQNGELVMIDGVDKGNDEPLIDLEEAITLMPGEIGNLTEKVETFYGNALYNQMVLVYAFRDIIPFQAGKLEFKKIEKLIAKVLQDDPEDDSDREGGKVYVSDLERYAEACGALATLNPIIVNAGTPKTMTINPAITKRLDELFIEHAHELDDPSVIAKIEKEVVDMDIDDFKDDRARKFYISKKTYEVARKRAFLMVGVEQSFGENNGKVRAIKRPLREGFDMNHFTDMVDSLRAGSFFRGNQTALGGQQVKDIYRVFQNAKVIEEDCGTTDGVEWALTEANLVALVDLYLAGKTPTLLTPEILKASVGSTILIRSPIVCKTAAPNYCAHCVGKALAATPTELPSAASDLSSRVLNMFMKRMHGVALRTARLKLRELIS